MKHYHNVLEMPRKIVVRNHRPKAIVVAEVEDRLRQYIIDHNTVIGQHTEDCRCHACFQKALDRLVDMSDQVTPENQ